MIRPRGWNASGYRMRYGRPDQAMLRECPRCGALPNSSCQRWVGGRVGGEDVGGGYAVPIKSIHPERKKAPPTSTQ